MAGYDSGVSSTAASFTRSSTEEEAGGRPLSWHQADPGLAQQRPQQLYDADDEMAGAGAGAGAARRQRRPTSLWGVSSLYSRDTRHPASPPGPAYQRRYEKGRGGTSRRRAARYSCGYISQSCAPRPYQAREPHPLSRRAREEDRAEADNLSNEVSLRLRESKDQMVERVMQVDWTPHGLHTVTVSSVQAPLNISERQKLLKARFLQLESPQCSREALKLDIFKVKYDKIMKEKPKKLLIGKIF